MRHLTHVLSIAAVVSIALASAAAARAPAAATTLTSQGPRVNLQPGVVGLLAQSTITVSGVHARSLEVRLAGATYATGAPLPWQPLRSAHGVWTATLPTPPLKGVYPIVLRSRAGAPSITPRRRAFLRVLDHGARERPSFDDPADVARWWVRTVPHGTLVALKAWPRPGFDRRDVRLHRLFVVAYSPPGHPQADDRLGMFVTAFRDGYTSRWRLLEATVEP
jgi:hypothetical protein